MITQTVVTVVATLVGVVCCREGMTTTIGSSDNTNGSDSGSNFGMVVCCGEGMITTIGSSDHTNGSDSGSNFGMVVCCGEGMTTTIGSSDHTSGSDSGSNFGRCLFCRWGLKSDFLDENFRRLDVSYFNIYRLECFSLKGFC